MHLIRVMRRHDLTEKDLTNSENLKKKIPKIFWKSEKFPKSWIMTSWFTWLLAGGEEVMADETLTKGAAAPPADSRKLPVKQAWDRYRDRFEEKVNWVYDLVWAVCWQSWTPKMSSKISLLLKFKKSLASNWFTGFSAGGIDENRIWIILPV